MFNTRGRKLTTIRPALARFIEHHEIGFVVLDSISRAGGSDLNESTTANEIMDMLNELCPSWLAIAHTPDANSKKIFGSTHFRNAADVTVMMESERRGNVTGSSYQLMKGNDVGAPPKTFLAFEFDDNRLVNVRRPRHDEFPNLVMPEVLTTQEQIIQFLRENGLAGTTEIALAIGVKPNTVAQELSRRKGTIFVSLEGQKWGLLFNESQSE